jgi:hypothetical protein
MVFILLIALLVLSEARKFSPLQTERVTSWQKTCMFVFSMLFFFFFFFCFFFFFFLL